MLPPFIKHWKKKFKVQNEVKYAMYPVVRKYDGLVCWTKVSTNGLEFPF
jgi:hypothetical protein